MPLTKSKVADFSIPHKKRSRYFIGLLALIQIVLGFLILGEVEDRAFDGAFLGLGFSYLIYFLYQTFMPCIQVKEGVLIGSSKPRLKMELKDIIQVKRFADEIRFKTKQKELMVSLNQIDKSDHSKMLAFANQIQEIISSNDSIEPAGIEKDLEK